MGLSSYIFFSAYNMCIGFTLAIFNLSGIMPLEKEQFIIAASGLAISSKDMAD